MQLINTLKHLLMAGAATRQSQYEIAVSSSGAIVGISLVAWVSYHIVGSQGLPFVVASMGAAAVLLYAAPHSPLTRPWSFVGGHLISASVGVSCAQWVPDIFLASGLAVGLAIFAMHQLNCLHPPGGAAALVAVVGGDQIQALGYLYVLIPVGLNVLILGSAVWLTRALLARHRQLPFIFYQDEHENNDKTNDSTTISSTDLNHALQDMHTYIDVSIEDLEQIYARASLSAHQRQLNGMDCRDLMKHHIVAVEFGDYLDVTWALMQQHNIKSIPVIDRAQRISGIITVSDFKQTALKYAGHDNATQNIEARLKTLIKRSGDLNSSKPEVVGQLMTSPVFTLAEDAPVSAAIAIFKAHHIGHIPITNHENRLAGMLSRSLMPGSSAD